MLSTLLCDHDHHDHDQYIHAHIYACLGSGRAHDQSSLCVASGSISVACNFSLSNSDLSIHGPLQLIRAHLVKALRPSSVYLSPEHLHDYREEAKAAGRHVSIEAGSQCEAYPE